MNEDGDVGGNGEGDGDVGEDGDGFPGFPSSWRLWEVWLVGPQGLGRSPKWQGWPGYSLLVLQGQSESVSLLSKLSSSFWKLSLWKILGHYKATKYRREKIRTE